MRTEVTVRCIVDKEGRDILKFTVTGLKRYRTRTIVRYQETPRSAILSLPMDKGLFFTVCALAAVEDLIHDAVLFSFFGAHKVVTLHVGFNFRKCLAGRF